MQRQVITTPPVEHSDHPGVWGVLVPTALIKAQGWTDAGIAAAVDVYDSRDTFIYGPPAQWLTDAAGAERVSNGLASPFIVYDEDGTGYEIADVHFGCVRLLAEPGSLITDEQARDFAAWLQEWSR